MTKFIKSAALGVAIAFGAAAGAPPAAAQTTTLTVDVEQMYKDSTAAKSGNTQLNGKYGAQLKATQSALESAAANWNTQVEAAKKVLKPDGTLPPANQTAVDQARQTLTEAQNNFEQLKQEIQYVDQYVKFQILEKLVPIAEKIRKDRKGDAVLPRNAVLAVDPVNDITAIAMQQLNATLTSVSITPPQQQQGGAPAAGAAPATTTPPAKQPQSR
ncbi:MAG: OmpH family outer membrane protein [Sphingomonas sp.]